MKKITFIICWIFITSFLSKSLLANEISAQIITKNDFIIGDENETTKIQ